LRIAGDLVQIEEPGDQERVVLQNPEVFLFPSLKVR
jgi:hypothetical protein